MGAKVYGIFALSYVSANVISYVVPKIFEEILDYQGLFIIMGLIPMISVLSMFLFHEKKLWVNPVN